MYSHVLSCTRNVLLYLHEKCDSLIKFSLDARAVLNVDMCLVLQRKALIVGDDPTVVNSLLHTDAVNPDRDLTRAPIIATTVLRVAILSV